MYIHFEFYLEYKIIKARQYTINTLSNIETRSIYFWLYFMMYFNEIL